MSEYVHILNHKGKRIVFMDCNGMKPEAIVTLFPEVIQTCIENRINRVLTDIANTTVSEAQKNAAKDFVQKVTASLGTLHTALVGVKGLQRIIAQAVAKDQYFAKTKEEGLDYLAAKG